MKARNEQSLSHEDAIALEWLTETETNLRNESRLPVCSLTNSFTAIRRTWEEEGKLRANHRAISFEITKSKAGQYLRAGMFPLTLAHFTAKPSAPDQPIKKIKSTKISSHKGRTLYRVGPYSVSVTRKTISERVGCGLRKNTSVCDWYAIDRADPVGGKSFSGYGGIRDAVAKLNKLATV